MYDPGDISPPRWRDGEADRWPDSYKHKHFATTGSHEAIGMHKITDAEWQRVIAFYYGMISFIDMQVGRLIDALEARDMLENTIVLFTSDHGEMLGDHHLVFKGTTFDEVTNVPLIISFPARVPSGEVRTALSSTIDIMPTLVKFVGLRSPASVQGMSLVPVLNDEGARLRDAVLIENAGVRRSVRTSDGLLTWHGEGKRGELYDLDEDPYCQHNLWDDPSAVQFQQQLTQRLLQLMAENVDPLPPRVGAC
jgi:arylsulfatase A-like enzyme